MAKPFTENADYVYQWLNDTNQISENLGDPVNVFTTDGDYDTHNGEYPSYLINTATYTHDSLEQNAVVRALNDLNSRKVKRTGDIISGNLRVNQNVIVDLDLLVQGGDLITSSSTFNLLNTTAATVNAFGSGTSINIGAATGLTTINHGVLIKGGATQSFTINDGTTTRFSVDSTNGNTLVLGTLGVTGAGTFSNNVVITGDLAVNGGDITSASTVFNFINDGVSTVNFANSVNVFTLANMSTGNHIVSMFGSTPATSLYSFASGPTAATNIKTINLGTGGLAGSTTNISIGATTGGTLTLASPIIKLSSKITNGVIYSSGGNGTIDVLSTVTANKMLLSGSSAAPVWSTAIYPASTSTNTFLFSKTANAVENVGFISGDGTIVFDYSTAGKVDLKTTGVLPSSTTLAGDLRVGSTRSATYTQSATTTIEITLASHGLSTSNWVLLDFTTGAGVDNAYQVTYVSPDVFSVQGPSNTTSGAVTVFLGGSGQLTKVLSLGTDTIRNASALFVRPYEATTVTKLVEVEDFGGNDKFVIDSTGRVTVTNDLYVQGNVVNTSSVGTVISHDITVNPVTTTSTTPTTLLSVSASTFRSIEYQIQVVEGSKFWTSKILAIHDGTNVNHTEYGMAGIGASPITSYTIDISAGNIILQAISASSSSTVYKVSATAITV